MVRHGSHEDPVAIVFVFEEGFESTFLKCLLVNLGCQISPINEIANCRIVIRVVSQKASDVVGIPLKF
jgi:hypothetical protein